MIILTQKLKLPNRIDASSLNPVTLAGLTLAQIEALPLADGLRLADAFSVTKGDSERMVIRTLDDGVEFIGAGMSNGEIRVEGDAGIYAGRAMTGGTLHVDGNVGDYAGQGKQGGLLVVSGNGGDYVGTALPGRTSGISGGAIIVKGSVGSRFGDRMRRGVLVALGDAGDHCASRAIAGTIWVRGRIGKSPAQALKRATLLLEQAPPELSTFLECGIHEMPVLRMLLPSLDRLAGTQVAANSSFHAKRYLGCIGVDGRGEVLVLT